MGTVYLLHFSRNFKHAKHYLGYAENDLDNRVEQHCTGQGARLTQVVVAAGIKLTLARTWEGSRRLERKLKRRKASPRLCPICLARVRRKVRVAA